MIRNIIFLMLVMMGVIFLSCKEDDGPAPLETAVKGTVKDDKGNAYSNTLVTLSNGTLQRETRTNPQGNFKFTNANTGTFEVAISPPLASTVLSGAPVMIEVKTDEISTVDVVIQTQPLTPHVNIGNVDIFGEIRKKNGSFPTQPTDSLYARNVFDGPIGRLTPLTAPNGRHLLFSEWETAKGVVAVNCNGNTSTFTIDFQGMIPNATYTLWLNFLNKDKKIGEAVVFSTDVVKIEPLGSGIKNIVIASFSGTIHTTIVHNSCVLTDGPGLVMPVLYHINGKTFGSAHIPDEEEATQMVVYFQ